MKINKKGIGTLVLISIIGASVLFIILLGSLALGGKTIEPRGTPQCKNPSTLELTLEGNLVIKDGQWIGIEPEIKDIKLETSFYS